MSQLGVKGNMELRVTIFPVCYSQRAQTLNDSAYYRYPGIVLTINVIDIKIFFMEKLHSLYNSGCRAISIVCDREREGLNC